MITDARFIVNEPHVVAEHFGGETVIVHLDTGVYYNLRDTAHVVWKLIADHGFSPREATEHCRDLYSVDSPSIDDDLELFTGSLVDEQLLLREDGRTRSPGAEEIVAGGGWMPPVLEVFSDLKDILMLDPVHDVDENGWPSARRADDAPPNPGS